MSRIDFGDGWAGPEPAGPSGRALFARAVSILPNGIAEKIDAGRMADAGHLLLAAPTGPALIRQTMDGWTMPGDQSFSAKWFDECSPSDLVEVACVTLMVWMSAGFFGPAGRLRFAAGLAQMKARTQPSD